MSVDADDVQQRWRGVAKHFPLWRFLIDLFFDWGSYRVIGSDITSMVIQNKSVRRAAAAMEGASDEMLAALGSIAKINEARSNDIFRAVFLGYVSVPIAVTAMTSDAAPEMLSSFMRDYLGIVIMLIIGAVVFPIVCFCGNWRAKQILWTVELYRAGALKPLDANGR
jgi:hypothetical protein